MESVLLHKRNIIFYDPPPNINVCPLGGDIAPSPNENTYIRGISGGTSGLHGGGEELALPSQLRRLYGEGELGGVSNFLSTYYVPRTKTGTLDTSPHLMGA